MSVTLTNLITEVQSRCNALTNSSTITQVIECGIAAKKVEMAGGTITRTTLDTQIQRFVTASGGGNTIDQLITLAATVEIQKQPKMQKFQEFNSSSTWLRPLGVNQIEVLLVGGGGGGGGIGFSSSSSMAGSGAGGGGQVIKKVLDVTSVTVGTTVSVTIGSGGSGGTNSGTAGAVGGDSSFGSLLTALGGGGGDGYIIGGSGSVSATVRASSGGGAGPYQTGGYGTLVLPGLGGGAGGNVELGTGAQSINGTAINVFLNHGYMEPSYTPVGKGSSFGGWNSSTSYYGYYSVNRAKPGAALYGYGAGGGYDGQGYSNTQGLFGAGGYNQLNANANSGGGGAGVSTSGSRAGGNGGSGYCLVTWWE